MSTPPSHNYRLTAEFVETVAQAVQEGVRAEAAAAAHGVPRSTFYDWLRWGREGRSPYSTLADKLSAARSYRRQGNSELRAFSLDSESDRLLRQHLAQFGEMLASLANNELEDDWQQQVRQAAAEFGLSRLFAPYTPIPPGCPTIVVTFRRHGSYWRIGPESSTFQLRDRKGLRHLEKLLRQPNVSVTAAALAIAGAGQNGNQSAGEGSAERARINVTRAIREAIRRIYDFDPYLADHVNQATRTGRSCCYHLDPDVAIAWDLGHGEIEVG